MYKYLLPVPLLLASNPALACGGFFCNQDLPVLQTAERILFAIDEQAGTVTTHVTIAYEGPAEGFAWVLPVPGQPELFTASEGLFEALAFRTQPSYRLDEVFQGDCWSWENDYAYSASSGGADSGIPEGVEVLDSKVVGPYETVTLAATSSEALLAWLNDNGFDLPADLDPKLAPYISGGMNFVALKLAKDQDAGDIVPFGMTYPGDKASIPIQLTAVAAQPDMRLEVYVFGDARAVPETYLHVVPNDLAGDWFGGTTAYEDVVSLAANEAGGHAFATDFSGDTAPFRGTFYQEGQYDLDSLAAATGAIDWMMRLIGQGFPPSAALVEVQEHVPLPEELAAQGVAETDWWNCLECYSDYSGTLAFDAVAATAALDARIVQPMRDAEDLFAKYGHLSRLTSSLDAVEMTVDPVFTFNADMPQELSNAHVATVTYWCPTEMDASEARRTVAFPGGYVVELPSQASLAAQGITEYEYMQSLTAINALVVESTGDAGEAAPVYDGRADLQGLVDTLNARTPGDPADFTGDDEPGAKGGCGCDSTGSPIAGGLILGLAALLVRRRRA